jgi:hypothetical protein
MTWKIVHVFFSLIFFAIGACMFSWVELGVSLVRRHGEIVDFTLLTSIVLLMISTFVVGSLILKEGLFSTGR